MGPVLPKYFIFIYTMFEEDGTISYKIIILPCGPLKYKQIYNYTYLQRKQCYKLNISTVHCKTVKTLGYTLVLRLSQAKLARGKIVKTVKFSFRAHKTMN